MSAVAPYLEEARVLDLFAGSGALGIEALSRGASQATFVESDAATVRVLKQNLAALSIGQDQSTIVKSDAVRFTEKLERGDFDVVFADPPYGSGHAARLVELFRITHFADLLCVEHSRSEKIAEGDDLRQRRYGDTTLSFVTAPDDS
jgi:16S rRNA (guanine966-N2)-methyltransferase